MADGDDIAGLTYAKSHLWGRFSLADVASRRATARPSVVSATRFGWYAVSREIQCAFARRENARPKNIAAVAICSYATNIM